MPGSHVSVAVVADRPALIREAGVLRWLEWGHGDPSPDAWVAVTAREAGRDVLPVTLVAVDAGGSAVGVVGLDVEDDALTYQERGGRTPWLVGMVVRQDSRHCGIGRLLMDALADVARARGHGRMWVVTGGEAVAYYRACGWSEVEQLPAAAQRPTSTVLTLLFSETGAAPARLER